LPLTATITTLSTCHADAHVSEQGLVLLLPTDIYTAAGVGVILATIFLLALVPASSLGTLFSTVQFTIRAVPRSWPAITSTASFFGLVGLVLAGLLGSRDPLINPLPLFIWTVWWIALLAVQATLFDIWFWLNPWRGPAVLIHRIVGHSARVRLPRSVGRWPAVVLFLMFSIFALADPAPDDPARLAVVVAGYSALVLIGCTVFGHRRWLYQCEFMTVLYSLFCRMTPIGIGRGKISVGLPGWQLIGRSSCPISLAIFAIILLGTGSFDGLNETFWWLAKLGINPLAFPGRSAIISQTILGLLLANGLLIVIFGATVWLGHQLAQFMDTGPSRPRFLPAFALLSMSLLPIALGYHLAHFLTAFLVNGQYALAALSDPLGNGADWLGLGRYYVSTGFLNSLESVRMIWLVQAGAVVVGHVISLLVAHRLANQIYGQDLRAFVSQLPLATFMVGYTGLGLWLLAAPRGA
jgi:hypothetical protein